MLAAPGAVITPYNPGESDPDDLLLKMDLGDSLRNFVDDFCLGHQRLLKRVPSARPGGSEPSRAKTKGAPRSA